MRLDRFRNGKSDDSSKPASLRKSRRKQRYELQEQVGAGGMGLVYRAYDRELDRIVAVKVLRSEYASTLSSLLRLKRELTLASKISDRHVVRVYDFGEIDGKPMISMDWVDGESLASLMGRARVLPPSQVYDFATQMCQALLVIHRADIVHRDLKPGNLLIDRGGRLLVTDFGLARSNRPEDISLNEPGTACGTVRYMAPEQKAGLPADERSDLYSFGIVLLEMLTGTTALEALESVRGRWLSSEAGRYIRSEELGKLAVLDAVIRRCVRLDRSDRYCNAEAVLADLKLAEYKVSSPMPLESNNGGRLPGKLTVTLACLTVALIILLLLFFRRQAGAPAETLSRFESADLLYADAIRTSTPTSGEGELLAAEWKLNDLTKRLTYLPAVQALVDVRIKLYEATTDPKWLTEARKELGSGAAGSLSRQQRTLLQARIDLNANLFSEAVRDLQDDRELLASSADANRLIGRGLEGSGQPAAALLFYRTAVDLSPESWISHNDLGLALLNSGSIEEARIQFVRVTELQPLSPAGFSNLGLVFLYSGDMARARENFEHALERQASPSTYFDLGLTMYFSHQYASAVPFFESGLGIRPNSDLYESGIAAALWHLGREDAGRDAYRRALAMLDEQEQKQALTTEQRCRRALYFARLGDSEMARTTLNSVARSRPEDQTVLYTAAVLAVIDGRRDAARRLLSKALRHGYPPGIAKLDPDLRGIF
jgi:Flp pilus assembly protein TadD